MAVALTQVAVALTQVAVAREMEYFPVRGTVSPQLSVKDLWCAYGRCLEAGRPSHDCNTRWLSLIAAVYAIKAILT